MPLPSFAKDSITVVRPAKKTVRGTTVQDWTDAHRSTVKRCSVQPGDTTTDEAAARDAHASETATVYLPPSAKVEAGDRVEWDNGTWEIIGRVQEWRSPTGRVTHKIMRMRIYEG